MHQTLPINTPSQAPALDADCVTADALGPVMLGGKCNFLDLAPQIDLQPMALASPQ